MQCEYKKETSRTFLTVHDESITETESFSMRMLCGGILPGMLRCHLKSVDGENCIYYDVTGLQTLRTTYLTGKLRFADIRFILEECIGVIEEMEDYLLIPDQLLLTPDHIFVNPERTKMYFCCFPGAFQDVRVQLSGLAEFILPLIDHNDRKGMSAGYGFYRSVMNDSAPINELREAIYAPDRNMDGPFSEEAVPEFDMTGRREAEILWNESFVREGYKTEDNNVTGEKKRTIRLRQILIYGGAAAAAVMAALILQLFFPGRLQLDTMIAGVFVCAVAGILLTRCIKSILGKKRKSSAVRDPVFKSHTDREFPEPAEEEVYTELSSFAGYKKGNESFTEAVFAETGKIPVIPELIPEDPSFPHIALREKLILIGSLPGAVDIVLKAPAVSRIHARIIKKGEDYYITDLHSKNGTMVNEMSIDNETEKLLENDDRIRFANVSYTVSGICPA